MDSLPSYAVSIHRSLDVMGVLHQPMTIALLGSLLDPSQRRPQSLNGKKLPEHECGPLNQWRRMVQYCTDRVQVEMLGRRLSIEAAQAQYCWVVI